jgi:hypothetical protein
MKPNVTLVTLGVADIARSRRFYCDGLGWRPSSAGNDSVVFIQAGHVVLALFPRDELAKDANLPATGSGFCGITLAQNVASKADVDAAIEDARRAGARILKPPQAAFWGGYTAYFADPDDYPWEIAFNPHWTLTAEGWLELPKSEGF